MTEQGTATFGYRANSAGVGPGHDLLNTIIDGTCVILGPESEFNEQHVSPLIFLAALYILHRTVFLFKMFAYPDDIFAPIDILLLYA